MGNAHKTGQEDAENEIFEDEDEVDEEDETESADEEETEEESDDKSGKDESEDDSEEETESEDEEESEDEDDDTDPLDKVTDPEELRKQAKKFRGIANRKGKPSQDGKPETKKSKTQTRQGDGGLTPMDVMQLQNAGITHEGDIEEVIKFAGYRKVDIKSALKDQTLKSILSDRAEKRRTANATNVGGARRGSRTPNPDQVLEENRKGNISDIDASVKARSDFRKKRFKKK